jgi:hypothetical protein
MLLFFTWSPSFSYGCHRPCGRIHCYCQVKAQSSWIGAALPNRSTWGGAGFRSSLPKGERPPGLMSCFSVEGSSPRWVKHVKEGFRPSQRGFFVAMVIMAIMCVLVEELLCQDLRGWGLALKSFLVRSAWVFVVMSHHARP